MPTVTAIIPSYNHARFVQSAVTSVVRQTFTDLEVIVVDDGSRDESKSVLEALSKTERFQLHAKPNSGLGATLNYGLERASGEFIGVCASDDEWLAHKIELQVAYLRAHPECVAVATNIQPIDEHGNDYAPATQHAEANFGFDEIFGLRATIAAPSVMVRRAPLMQVGGYDTATWVEDWPTWLKLTEHGARIGLLSDVCVRYRHHGTNMHRARPAVYRAGFEVASRYAQHPLYAQTMKDLSRRAFIELSSTDRREALTYAARFFKYLDDPRALADWQVLMGALLWSTPRALAPRLERLFSTTISATSGLRAALRRARN